MCQSALTSVVPEKSVMMDAVRLRAFGIFMNQALALIAITRRRKFQKKRFCEGADGIPCRCPIQEGVVESSLSLVYINVYWLEGDSRSSSNSKGILFPR